MSIECAKSVSLVPEIQTTPSPSLFPTTLFVEPTTRCNLRCRMCVKQDQAGCIEEGDIAFETFQSLIPAFAHVESLILTGIGEPLLHPDLEKMISLARRYLPEESRIGFQTNGMLLEPHRAKSLLQAGLDRICLSLDAASPQTFQNLRSGGKLAGIDRALEALDKARSRIKANRLKIGIEFVLMKNNYLELPEVVRWAAKRGVTFIIITHMLPYNEALEPETMYPINLDGARDLFLFWQGKAQEQGVDLRTFFNARGRYIKTTADEKVIDLVGSMISEAYMQEIFLLLEDLLEEDENETKRVKEVFAHGQSLARSLGLELILPEVRPKKDRRCDFVEENSAFVSWQGAVHPCYLLWHRYTCYRNGNKKFVEPKSFGRLDERGIMEIWNDPEFIKFREGVRKYDYPYCWSCNVAPCDLIYTESFDQDCFGVQVPCGDCPWCMGLLHCLR
ncbi:MAG: radical SAM/SPASM family putative metalloenzyme maturase [Deltaproteobacteria bacterium]|nr:radical SAM/SPASM family putative metalloenzyme maturase [Deltaproteobacteria bacterium]